MSTRRRGRPTLPPAEANYRRERWRLAMRSAGLTAEEVATLIGRSVPLVWSYSSESGSVPTPDALRALERHCVDRARSEIERITAISDID